jgi:cyclic pyranopterin phosphate synthase
LIPLSWPFKLPPIHKVDVQIVSDAELPGAWTATVRELHGETGVEMEALTAVSVAALTRHAGRVG